MFGWTTFERCILWFRFLLQGNWLKKVEQRLCMWWKSAWQFQWWYCVQTMGFQQMGNPFFVLSLDNIDGSWGSGTFFWLSSGNWHAQCKNVKCWFLKGADKINQAYKKGVWRRAADMCTFSQLFQGDCFPLCFFCEEYCNTSDCDAHLFWEIKAKKI